MYYNTIQAGCLITYFWLDGSVSFNYSPTPFIKYAEVKLLYLRFVSSRQNRKTLKINTRGFYPIRLLYTEVYRPWKASLIRGSTWTVPSSPSRRYPLYAVVCGIECQSFLKLKHATISILQYTWILRNESIGSWTFISPTRLIKESKWKRKNQFTLRSHITSKFIYILLGFFVWHNAFYKDSNQAYRPIFLNTLNFHKLITAFYYIYDF